MRRNIIVFRVLIISLVMTVVLFGQSRGDFLTEKHVKIKARGGSIWEAVHDLARAGVPIGFEPRTDLNVETDPRVSLNEGKLGDILNSLVAQDTSYKWEINEGVVNIYPVSGRSELIASFLKTTIGPIGLVPGDKRISIIGQIENSPGVKGFLENLDGSKVVIFQSTVLGLDETISKELNISEADSRTVLNRLAISGMASNIWKISLGGDPKTIFVVY